MNEPRYRQNDPRYHEGYPEVYVVYSYSRNPAPGCREQAHLIGVGETPVDAIRAAQKADPNVPNELSRKPRQVPGGDIYVLDRAEAVIAGMIRDGEAELTIENEGPGYEACLHVEPTGPGLLP